MHARDKKVVLREQIAFLARMPVVVVRETVFLRFGNASRFQLIHEGIRWAPDGRVSLYRQCESLNISIMQKLSQSPTQRNDVAAGESLKITRLQKTVLDESL